MGKIMDNSVPIYETSGVASTLKSRHGIDAENYESGFMYIAYEYSDFLKLVVASFRSFLHHNLYEKLNIRNNQLQVSDNRYAISENDGDRLSKEIGGLGSYTRIRKQKSDFKISMCVQKYVQLVDTNMVSSITNTRPYSLSQEEKTKFNEIAYKELVTTFGADIFDIDTGIDVEIPADSILINRPTLDLAKTVANEKIINITKKYVKSFRLISSPLELPYPYKEYVDGNEVIITKLKAANDKAAYINKVLENRKYSVYVNLTLTPEETNYITQTDFENTSSSYVATWFVSWCTGDLAGGFASPEAINPISSIAEENSLVDTTKLRPRTNSDELSISGDGYCYFIPTIDNAKQYDDELEQLGSRADGDFCYEDDKEIKKSRVAVQDIVKKQRLPTNRIIYTDWSNNKLAYSDTNGALKIMDLEGYMPCTNNVYSRILGASLMQQNKDNTIRLNHLSFAIRYAIEKGVTYEIKDEDKDFVFQNEPFLEEELLRDLKTGAVEDYTHTVYHKLNRKVSAVGRPDYIEEYAHKDAFIYALIDENSPIPALRPLGRLLKAAYEVSIKDIPNTLEYRSVINGLGQLALLTILVKYMGKKSIIDAADAEDRKVYTNPDFDPDYKPEGIALVKGISLQPHQVKVFTYLKNIPKNAIISSDAGGGKTIQVLLDILFNINKGVKKPLIMCPSHLVKDYIKEANFVAKGRLNVVPITTATFKVYGADKLKQLIEHSPINTVFITDYNFIKGNVEDVVYGTTIITVGHNAEFLRQFDWDYVALDESHMLKNTSQRQASVQRLVSEIPIKRLATGTFVSDTILDIVKQFALLDPSVFGSQQKFIELYANETRGGKVLSWKSGTESLIASKMKQFATVVNTKRKEWAALLPDRIEEFHFVELTTTQRAVYDAILQETIEIIRANKELMEKLNSQDETLADELEAMLRPYLARLEQFLSAPASDPAGKVALLDSDDIISPKVKMVHKLCRDHLADASDSGNILIFTSYKESARIIYESMPQEIKDITVFYTAETKFQAGEEFENNPNKRIMVGVENSMNTGLNLQACSRLIRIETVWNPGTLEQGESRINRPELKKKETRKNIHFDWIITNNSIDVTKIGRLIGKIISKTKFDEYQNQLYDGLPDIELVTMSLDSITQHNDFRTTLSDHLEAFQTLKQIEQSEFDAYRNDPKVKKDMVDVPDGNIPNGSKLLKHVPYVSGLQLYGQADLGLVGYNEFLRNELDEDFDPIGLQIHTEFGDGECIGVRKNTLRVRLSDGSSVSVDKLAAFVITRKSTSTKDIRHQLMKLAGLAPATTDDLKKVRPEGIVDEKPTPPRKTKVLKPVPNKDDKLNNKFNLYFTIINNSIALGVDTEDPDVHQKQLAKYGFKPTSPYLYTHVRTARTMRLLIDQLTSKFEVGSQYVNRLEALYQSFNLGKSKLLNVNQANQVELKNFLRLKFKASGSKELKPYPLIQDGELYILIDTTMQPAAKRVPSKIIGSGIKWFNEGGDLYAFFGSKGDVKSAITQMKKDGLEIENLEDLKAEFSEIKLFKRKS